ncbi:vanadium-dependent haloperoxidase [Actinomadura sp. ATCC 31491]|uniref:Vanadium-dependent haloperoxidase n=1 Tax=Actinomadura luzonensis TaxID=2805427 RepID=A0ABT0FZA3_9ACTN|nr:vanadium-dependent haloperoxidase [Actinomadura luzonensis]MCK2217669.1 vanadium-dependent haloperoxidase [Actinomadura luzonensis]
MRKLVMLLVLLPSLAVPLPAAAAPPAPDVDAAGTWSQAALDAIRTHRASDSDAARTYAMVGAALYDAVNGIATARGDRARTPALRDAKGAPPQGDQQAAAVAAAHAVLVRLYPDAVATLDARLAADLARLGQGPRVSAGRSWGATVGADVYTLRQDDGSSPVEAQPAGTGPGVFGQEWPGAQYRHMRPFADADAARHLGGGPPALDSLDYAAAFAEVALLGNAAVPDAGKSAVFQFWSLPAGSDQPPGAWVQIALAAGRTLPLADKARLLALLGMALADTAVPTTLAKYTYRHWRPQVAIQQADTDGNPYTTADPAWRARAGSAGGTPEYISGHSSFSGAGAAVLAGFFCSDRVPFTLVTDSAPVDPGTGQPWARSFPGFSAAAADAGRSRVLGGLHFGFSNLDGLAMGRDVAADILAAKLLPRSGPTHVGACPR